MLIRAVEALVARGELRTTESTDPLRQAA
jgi:hypothetical protein